MLIMTECGRLMGALNGPHILFLNMINSGEL